MDRKTRDAAACSNSVSYVGHQKVSLETMERIIHTMCRQYDSIYEIFSALFYLITVKNTLNL
jgi:hypothetical protein